MQYDFRDVAIKTLNKMEINNAYSNIVINSEIRKLDFKYQNLFRKSILGVTENRYFLDFAINCFSNIRTRKLNCDVLSVLRLAIYQIYFLDNIREDIIVNESVEYIKDNLDIKSSKYVNAILRNILRNKDKVYNKIERLNKTDRLSVLYSFPIWIINKWRKQYGEDNIEYILSKNNEQADLNIRVNTTKISKQELIKSLEARDIGVKNCEYADKGLIVTRVNNIDNLKEFNRGYFSIQSESSMLVSQILDPKENSLVLDVCAAPGGKSLDVAERLNNTGKVISRDLYNHKINLIESSIKRLGLHNIIAEKYDALTIDDSLLEKVDYCIVDVPCTGLGIIRRKPEIKYNRKEEESNNLFSIQYQILINASKYLKIGGELVYSTCTTLKDENINIIKKFIKYNKDFILVDITKQTKNKFNSSKKGYIEIYPHIHNLDGFFVAKFKKVML